jgi:hypothetical protein
MLQEAPLRVLMHVPFYALAGAILFKYSFEGILPQRICAASTGMCI